MLIDLWFVVYCYGVSIYTKCKYLVLLTEDIYSNSTHQHVIGIVNYTKDG